MLAAPRLLGRLVAVVASAATVGACAEKVAPPMEPKATTKTADAPSSSPAVRATPAPSAAATVSLEPTPNATSTPGPTVGVGTPGPSAKSLPACLGCTPLCYGHPKGEACLPADAGEPLDAKLSCYSRVKGQPTDDGQRCCYAQACKGRPLVATGTARVAPLVADSW